MKQENLELVIVDYPQDFLYWKLNYKKRWSSSAFPSVLNMFVKVVGIPAIFDDSQLLAGYHWHFHAYPMILSVMQLTIVWILKSNAHTHAHTLTHTHACSRQFTVWYFNWMKYFKMCAWFFKMYVVICISNHYIRIKIQDIFWNAWSQRTILVKQGLFWLNPLKF